MKMMQSYILVCFSASKFSFFQTASLPCTFLSGARGKSWRDAGPQGSGVTTRIPHLRHALFMSARPLSFRPPPRPLFLHRLPPAASDHRHRPILFSYGLRRRFCVLLPRTMSFDCSGALLAEGFKRMLLIQV